MHWICELPKLAAVNKEEQQKQQVYSKVLEQQELKPQSLSLLWQDNKTLDSTPHELDHTSILYDHTTSNPQHEFLDFTASTSDSTGINVSDYLQLLYLLTQVHSFIWNSLVSVPIFICSVF